MLIENARTAAQLAKQIDERTEIIALIDAAIAGGWLITDLRVTSPEGRVVSLILGPLDNVVSLQGLEFARGIYQTQLTALNEALAALT